MNENLENESNCNLSTKEKSTDTLSDVVFMEKPEEKVKFKYRKVKGALVSLFIAIGIIGLLFVVFLLINLVFKRILPLVGVSI